MGKAILYARVSTDEQVKHGFSLAQQLEALRAYAAREGYEVLEEVADPGQSGASLERPGMDRVRDLVAAGGVSVVLAQDRDRFAREPAYLYLLRQEFAEHGTKLRSLNDRGDESPEGELTDGILDQLAKYERAKTAERSRRGRLRKAREGKLIASERADFGFRYDEARTGYEVDPEHMALVRRIFQTVAGGSILHFLKRTFEAEGIPAPGGGRFWDLSYFAGLIKDNVYLPHTEEELFLLVAEGLLSEEVARRTLEGCGIRWHNRQSIQKRSVRDGTRYRKAFKRSEKPREEWIAVPVTPAGIPRAWVESARRAIAKNRRAPKTNRRFWELSGGILRCAECGRAMFSYSPRSREKHFHYYRCAKRAQNGKEACPNARHVRAEETEEMVWESVSRLLSDPAKLSAGLAEATKTSPRDTRDQGGLVKQLAATDKRRARYQEMAAEELISFSELRERLHELDEERARLVSDLSEIEGRAERAKQRERDVEALVAELTAVTPERLARLPPEGRHGFYRALELEVTAGRVGQLAIKGLLTPLEFLNPRGVYTADR